MALAEGALILVGTGRGGADAGWHWRKVASKESPKKLDNRARSWTHDRKLQNEQWKFSKGSEMSESTVLYQTLHLTLLEIRRASGPEELSHTSAMAN